MILQSEATDTLKITADQLQMVCDEVVEKDLFSFSDHYGALTSGGLLTVLIYMFLMVALAFFFYKKERVLEVCDRYLTHAFVVVWALGFVIYDLGMYPDHGASGIGAFWSLLGVAPMAVIHAFGMFILQSDVSAIHSGCHNSSWYMFCFSMVHLMAAFISMVFVIKHFGFNIVASFIRVIKTHFWVGKVDDLYVLWGMNNATYYLAKDIIKNTKQRSNARVIIARVNNREKDTMNRIGMDRLFNFLSLSNNHLDNLQQLQKLGCLTNSTFGSPAEPRSGIDNNLIGRELRLNSIVRLMKHTTGAVHMLMLEDEESFNIQAVANLKQDDSVKAFAEHGKVKFYCRARHGSVHRVIEDELPHKNIEVHVVDSSHISIELLKQKDNIDKQPVSYVDIEPDATVSSAFNALVVGFGEVGLDAVRFLYEFSAFVKNGSTRSDVERSDFHCDVVDNDMESMAGIFFANTPALNPRPRLHLETETYVDDCAPSSLIDLHKMDYRSVKFYSCLEKWLPDLNYVVLATDDDEVNVSMAVRIFRLAIRYKKNLDKFRIMVLVRHDENGHFRQITQYFNRLWKAEYAIPGNRFNQNKVKVEDVVNGPISLFGASEEIYTFNHILNEELKENAKTFKAKYDKSVYEMQQATGLAPDPIISWDEQQNLALQLTGEYKDYSPTYSSVMQLRRNQDQNVANSLHATTKVTLALEAFSEQEREMMSQHGLVRDAGKTIYRWKDGANEPIDRIQRVMDTLAQTEHLRWIASHELHGYQQGSTMGVKEEAKLQHGYMCEWSKLPDNIMSYDYNTVDISLKNYGFYNNQGSEDSVQ